MQIEFERSIQLIDEDFVLKDKLDTENIMYFLNVAQDRYLKETYLSKGSLQENIQFIQKRADDLKQLVVRTISGRTAAGVVTLYSALFTAVPSTTEDGGQILRLPYGYLFYMLSRSEITRSTVAVAADEWTSNKVITHGELDKVIITPFNDPILRQPCILFEEAENMIVYSDSDTAISDMELIYIRDPDKLLLEAYAEISTAGAIGGAVGDIYTIVSDVATIDPDPGGAPADYDIGETYTVANILDELDAGTIALSHLAFGTNTCELAPHTHQEIVDLAVRIFIEEIKYKVQKAQPQIQQPVR